MAAGHSRRMGFDKLWVDLGDRPVLAWSLAALAESGVIDRLALVVSRDRVAVAHRLLQPYTVAARVVIGGERRRDSVAAGLDVLEGTVRADRCEWVVVHDGARPFLTPDLVHHGIAAAQETGAAVAAVPVQDTIKRVSGSDVVETLPRSKLRAIQTPQVFRRDLLQAALAASTEDVTDEAALVEAAGATVRVYPGDRANLKITVPEDLELARALLSQWAAARTP